MKNGLVAPLVCDELYIGLWFLQGTGLDYHTASTNKKEKKNGGGIGVGHHVTYWIRMITGCSKFVKSIVVGDGNFKKNLCKIPRVPVIWITPWSERGTNQRL